ncbi:MAG: hypothetical protein OEZ04_07065 [Nitrospinota bacterium]|nr:hypothetical protein [Nitrospinota bacterium]
MVPPTVKAKTGHRSSQALAMAGWGEITGEKKLQKETPKAQARLAKR